MYMKCEHYRVRLELAIVGTLCAIALLAHGINMFDYPAPSLSDDEGTYVAQAWAVLREGRLAPYTYTYDHVPGGWLQIAAWLGIVGPRAFDSVIASTRVLMLGLHVTAVALLYVTTRRFAARPAAIVAALAFGVSPLAVFYARQTILDNIMAFWLVAAVALLAFARSAREATLAGMALGIASLSKEPALILVPIYVLLAALRAPRSRRVAWVVAITAPVLCIVAIYPVYAFARGELWLTSDSVQTVSDPRAYAGSSLLDSILWQAQRSGGTLSDPDSLVHAAFGDWLHRDAVLVLVGLASALANALRFRSDPTRAAIGALAIVSLGFLVRGGVVYAFHAPLTIPFLSMNLGLGAMDLVRDGPRSIARRPTLTCCVGIVLFWTLSGLPHLYLDRPAGAERAAIAWIERTVPSDAVIVGRDDMWAELHEPQGTRTFAGFYTHWLLSYDVEVRRSVLVDGWRSIDFIVVTDSLLHGIRQTTHDGELMAALRNARLVGQWVAPTTDESLHPPQIVEIWEVEKTGTSVRMLVDCDTTPSLLCAMTTWRTPDARIDMFPHPSPSER